MSNNPAVIANPAVVYTRPAATGSLTYTPVAGASGTATITVTVTDSGDTANGGSNMSVPRTFTIVVAPPITMQYAVNDGNAQRSMVKSVTVTFNQLVDLAAGAMTVAILEGNGAGKTLVVTPSVDKRSAVITFAGTPVVGGSLADGVYGLSPAPRR